MKITAIGLLAASLLLPAAALAHKPAGSYLTLSWEGDVLTGRWDLAVRDLEHALGLDADLDGAVTWGELRARQADVATYALARLTVAAGGEACTARPTGQLVDRHTHGVFSVLLFTLDCQRRGSLHVDYRLFFDLDPSHRGLLRVESPAGVRTATLSMYRRSVKIDVVAHAGYRGEQEPRAVIVDGDRLEVAEVRRRWAAPDGRYFDVRLADRRTFVLRAGSEDGGWSVEGLGDPAG